MSFFFSAHFPDSARTDAMSCRCLSATPSQTTGLVPSPCAGYFRHGICRGWPLFRWPAYPQHAQPTQKALAPGVPFCAFLLFQTCDAPSVLVLVLVGMVTALESHCMGNFAGVSACQVSSHKKSLSLGWPSPLFHVDLVGDKNHRSFQAAGARAPARRRRRATPRPRASA